MSKFMGSLLVIILLVTVGIESFDFVPLYGYVYIEIIILICTLTIPQSLAMLFLDV